MPRARRTPDHRPDMLPASVPFLPARPPTGGQAIPGVNFRTEGLEGLSERWKKRCTKFLGTMRNAKAQAELAPFLDDAEEWLIAAATQLAGGAGGVCGAIEMNALQAAAWQTAYARYWMHLATQDPTNLKLVEVASRLQDAARANSLSAYELAIRLHHKRNERGTQDPLAAFAQDDSDDA